MTAPTYTDSKGKSHEIADMPNGYLHAALAKVKRDHPARTREIADMQAEVDRRLADMPDDALGNHGPKARDRT